MHLVNKYLFVQIYRTGKNQCRAAGRGRAHNLLIGIFLGKLWVQSFRSVLPHQAMQMWNKKKESQCTCMYVHTNNSEKCQGFLGAFCAWKFASLRSDLLFSRGCNFCFFQKGLHELRIIPALRSACSASYTSVHAFPIFGALTSWCVDLLVHWPLGALTSHRKTFAADL